MKKRKKQKVSKKNLKKVTGGVSGDFVVGEKNKLMFGKRKAKFPGGGYDT